MAVKSLERSWFVGRLGLNVRWSSDHMWEVTQAKTGNRHVQRATLSTIHRRGEPTLYALTIGPLCVTVGDALGKAQ